MFMDFLYLPDVTRFFIYIFVALIAAQAVSVEYLGFMDFEEVEEVLQDMSEESDSSEEESEVKDHFDGHVSHWSVDGGHNKSLSKQMMISNVFLESICIEIPSPPPDLV